MAVIFIVVAYLLGSIPSSVWISRVFFGMDIRDQGSGNAGATNTIRVLGWKVGVLVLIIDALKGWLAVYLGTFVPVDSLYNFSFSLFQIVLAIASVLGHIFPVFAGFKGGKGVATLLGVAIALFPWQVILIELGVFALIFITTRIVSVGSMLVAISLPFLVYAFGVSELPILVLSIVIALFIPITHRTNIQRLLKGEEKKLEFRKS